MTTAIRLKEPDHVPVSPFMIWHIPVVAGVKMNDYAWDVDTCYRANFAAYRFYEGGLDAMNLTPMLLAYSNPNPPLYSCLYFNWRFFDDAMPQFIETELVDENIYDQVIGKGFSTLRTFKRI